MKLLVDHDIHNNPKVLDLASKLDLDADYVVGKLIRLWGWTLHHRESGKLSGIKPRAICRLLQFGRIPLAKQSAFVQALIECGFLDQDPENGVLEVHDWEEHQGPLIAERARDRARKRAERVHPDVHRTSTGHPPGRPPAPSPSLPSPALPRGHGDGLEPLVARADDPSLEASGAAPRQVACAKCRGSGKTGEAVNAFCSCPAGAASHATYRESIRWLEREPAKPDPRSPAEERRQLEEFLREHPEAASRVGTLPAWKALRLLGLTNGRETGNGKPRGAK